ncbi:ribosome maturation factor RimP [soil metagenome]
MDLAQAAREVLEPLGFEVLELERTGQGEKRRLLLRIDRLDEQLVSMEDVTLATQVFSLELDRLDPFAEPYELEVESPGSERPLITARHFERFHDLKTKVRLGSETFKGTIRGVEGDAVKGYIVVLEVGKETKRYKLAEIQARLAEWPSEPREKVLEEHL